MSRHHREWTDRFSDYLAGEVDEPGRAEIEAHLAGCGACRDVLAGLRDVVGRAEALADLEPPRELWAGIASAIGAPVRAGVRAGGRTVIELPSARGGAASVPPSEGGAGRIRVRRSQLAAAAAALVLATAGTTWWIAAPRTGASPAAEIIDTLRDEAVTAAAAGTPPADLAGELATLEEVLDVARGALDPYTVRVLERNLDVIEQAIADSREALALDPGNAFLNEHLERMYRRKLVYLQDVARVVQWAG